MAEGTPPGARRFRVAESSAIDVYVNPDSGQIICVLEAARRTYEWMYYALHTFKFPGLAQRPLLRHVVVLAPLALGFLFSVTGVIIAVTRVRASVDFGSARHNT